MSVLECSKGLGRIPCLALAGHGGSREAWPLHQRPSLSLCLLAGNLHTLPPWPWYSWRLLKLAPRVGGDTLCVLIVDG